MSTPEIPTASQEKTFRAYTPAQGQVYSQARRDYHPKVYQTVIDHHTSTGGQLGTLLDVGCGPGNATCALAPHFTHAIGLDPSEGMISTARALTQPSQPNIRYEISQAEQLGSNLVPPIQEGSIDLITAANAAHWFDMAGFWTAASRVLKPRGTVAIWTSGPIRPHPSMPNASAIQAAMDEHSNLHMKPYLVPGNFLTRNEYRDLPLPWTLPAGSAPTSGAFEFDKSSFVRLEWPVDEPFFTRPGSGSVADDHTADLDTFEKMMATGSAETRWRQAHPDLVGTDADVIKQLRHKIERILHEAGVKPGEESLRGVVSGVLLFVKKK